MKRIVLFAMTNIAVLALIGLISYVFGLDRWLAARHMNIAMLLVISAIFGFAGSFISLAISKWMAKMAYSIQVIEKPQTQDEEWLYRTVERLSRDAGISMPEIGYYESPEANAFATGPSRNSALVAVSTGLLQQMNHREVEAVLAHEVGHITNGDMVTMTLLQGVLNTFVGFFSRLIGMAIDNAMRRDNDRGGLGMGYMLGYFVSSIVLGLFAMVIQMAYSRQREFAADAMAAKLTDRESMIAALARLKSVMENGGVFDNSAPSMNTFKISHPESFMALFSSHPPLEKRIEALRKLKS
ncbi:MAG: protease HtpX [Verrucomicrobiota bacterium]